MNNDVEEILFSEALIQEKINQMGKQISNDYKGETLHVIGVMKGGVIFTSDLIRAIELPIKLDFVSMSSYGLNCESSGIVTMDKDISLDVEGENVIIAEDIIDSGRTLKKLYDHLRSKNPKSLKICTMLDKPARRQADIKADYVGFEIPDKFAIGYGLDYAEHYRNLPYIGVLKPSVYSE